MNRSITTLIALLVLLGVAPSMASEEGDTENSTGIAPFQMSWELPPSLNDGIASGISPVQGWVYSEEGGIASVVLRIDGQIAVMPPCCSERGDVSGAIPGAPLFTGFSAAVNWGNYAPGFHTAEITITDTAGNELHEGRLIVTQRLLPDIPFARNLQQGPTTDVRPFTEVGTGLVGIEVIDPTFDQGTCNGSITFLWSNAKQTFELVEGCSD